MEASKIIRKPLPTKWREFIPTLYLGLDDLIDRNGKYQTFAVTTDHVEAHLVENPKNHKKEDRLVVFFKNSKKGMILNATLCKELQALTGTPDPAQWGGVDVELYVERNVRTPQGKQDVVRFRARKGKLGGHAQMAEPPIDTDVSDVPNLEELSEEEMDALVNSVDVEEDVEETVNA